MKITLSKSQWKMIGSKAGWLKSSGMEPINIKSPFATKQAPDPKKEFTSDEKSLRNEFGTYHAKINNIYEKMNSGGPLVSGKQELKDEISKYRTRRNIVESTIPDAKISDIVGKIEEEIRSINNILGGVGPR